MVEHCSKTSHYLAMSFTNLSVWCYECDRGLSHLSIREVYDVYCLFYLLKSGTSFHEAFSGDVEEETVPRETKTGALGATGAYKPFRQGRFHQPSLHQQLQAVKVTLRVGSKLPQGGSLSEAEMFSRLFPAFSPILLPESGDWLAENKEDPEDLAQFARLCNKVTEERKTIYILPLGELDPSVSPSLTTLRLYAETFLGVPVSLLPAVKSVQGKTKQCVLFSTPGHEVEVAMRINAHTKLPQLMAKDLSGVMARFLPKDAHCMIGVTMTDLYSSSSWNFVFGEANLHTRMGVFSFARYSPLFMTTKLELVQEDQVLLLRRSCRVMVHELFHMFGAGHCVFAHCCMNGANHLEEDDRQPLFFCPVDLAKLYYVRPFRLIARLEALRTFCENYGFEQDVGMLEAQISFVRGLPAPQGHDKPLRTKLKKPG